MFVRLPKNTVVPVEEESPKLNAEMVDTKKNIQTIEMIILFASMIQGCNLIVVYFFQLVVYNQDFLKYEYAL